ncbi:LeuA family protein [Actinomadura rayongensis]|uniref:homocitrate synthase/isopropylmalate synthase family protein n=1 Tax=Actinomadura rayongensis TaxID=1429076 RepID=UPI0019260C6E
MEQLPVAPNRRISLFDTTLRDGEQAPGNAMLPEQKLRLALTLEALGVDVVEAGFPASSPDDFTATRLLTTHLSTSKVTSFARASVEDVDTAIEAGGCDANHQVQILATASELHLAYKRGIDRAASVREIRRAAEHAAERGVQDISIAFEDSSRGSDELLQEYAETAGDVGASTVVVCDTSGSQTPAEFGALVARVRGWLPEHVRISTHCHNDMGMAVANALAGIRAGADQVQVTLAGIGERAGNTALEELVAVLAMKGDLFGVDTNVRSELLFDAYHVLQETIGLVIGRNKPLFGQNAFATQAGIHQSAILRNPETYEYLDPERFGRRRSLLVGRHSGRAVLHHLIGEMGLPSDPELVDRLYQDLVVSRGNGECDDLDTLRGRILDHGLVRRDGAGDPSAIGSR